DLVEGTGLFASSGRLSDGRPVVAFFDRTRTDLMIAVRDGGVWTVTPLDAGTDRIREGDLHPVGGSATIFLDVAGQVAIAYQDQADLNLLLAQRSGESWTHT